VDPSGGTCRVRSNTRARNCGVSFCGGWPGCMVARPSTPSFSYRCFQRETLDGRLPVSLRCRGRQIPFPQVALQFAFGRSQVQDFHLRYKYMTKNPRYLLLGDSPLACQPLGWDAPRESRLDDRETRSILNCLAADALPQGAPEKQSAGRSTGNLLSLTLRLSESTIVDGQKASALLDPADRTRGEPGKAAQQRGPG
jgi:hypothetical protein